MGFGIEAGLGQAYLLLTVQQLALRAQRLLFALLPRPLHLRRLQAIPLHLDLLRLRVVTLLRQGHLEGEVEAEG